MGEIGINGQREGIKLSVIIAVYNVEEYVRKCLDSIIGQTYKNLEIIIVDDGSTDHSGKICDEYAQMDERIQVIHKENGGLVSARKAGIEHATGEYMIHIDSDDWVEYDAWERIVEKLEIFHPDMLAFGYKKEYDGFTEEYKQRLEEGFYNQREFWDKFHQCVRENPFFVQPIDMSQCNKVIKTNIAKLCQMSCPDSLKKNTDDAVNFPCLLSIQNIYCHEGTYYHYCVRKSSIIWHSSKKDYEQVVVLLKHLISAYKEKKSKTGMTKEFLLYKLFYHLILDVPEKLFCEDRCLYLPQLKKDCNVIIYGKGVLASRFICRVRELHYCNIVENIDKTDAEKIMQIEKNQYDYVLITVFNGRVVEDIIDNLLKLGVEREKILYIHKEDLTPEILPMEVKELWEHI